MSRRRRLLVLFGFSVAVVALETAAGLLGPTPGLAFTQGRPALALALTLMCLIPMSLLPAGERWAAAIWGLAVLPHAGRLAGLELVAWGGVVLLACVLWVRPRVGLGLAAFCSVLPSMALVQAQADPVAPRPAAATPDILLVTIDTLRWDHSLDLGARWQRFDEAIAPAPWTLPSMYSVMTGAPVRRHLGGLPAGDSFTAVDPRLPWLPEQLQAQGARTAAFVSNPHLRGAHGFSRGFDRFLHADSLREPYYLLHAFGQWRHRLTGELPALRAQQDAVLVNRAARWWAQTQGPRFAWVHLMGPHEYRRDPTLQGPQAEATPERLEASYRRQVRQVRTQVLELVGGVGDDTLILVTSDHGESMGEEELWGHGSALVDPQLRVPLWVRWPGAQGVVKGQVSLTQVAAALRSAAPQQLQGGSPVVELGGLRRDPSAFSLRMPGGAQTPRPAPDLTSRPGQPATLPMDDALRDSLRALGYQD